jgi:NADH/NAD ratio-sensing transcriptional regulator Rex
MLPLTKILKRWRALDRELMSITGMNLKSFARKQGVTTRTVRRDIEVFREVGQLIVSNPADSREHLFEYDQGADRLFNR